MAHTDATSPQGRRRPGASAAIRPLALVAALISVPASAAPSGSAPIGAWVVSPQSRARVVRVGDGYGVEIALGPGALTYWRWPGAAGVAPRVDAAGSDNVASVDLLFPAPSRLPEAGEEVLGYLGLVVLPLAIVPSDAGRPGRLRLGLDYATCDRLCVPAHADFDIPVPVRGDANPASDDLSIEGAASSIPATGTPFPGVLARTRDGAWRADLVPDAGVDDLVAGSDGADVSTRRIGPSTYEVVVHGSGAVAPVTLVSSGQNPRAWSFAPSAAGPWVPR